MLFADAIQSAINATAPQRGAVPNNEMDKTAFLRLLTAQLQNQDPMNPTDQENFVQQVATFSNLEQQMATNESFTKLLQFQLVGQAASLIGQEVTGLVNGEVVAGKVQEVIFVNGEPYLSLSNGGELPHSALISIGTRTPAPATPPAADPPAEEPADEGTETPPATDEPTP